MEGINHKTVAVNGINMHIAEKGEGPVVLLLHGFPDLWYSWRHQIVSLASWGYRAIAPDLRGYGDTDTPPDITSYSIHHLVGDIVALIDSLGLDQVFVVGHDWGAMIAWQLCVFRPDRVKALVSLSVHFFGRHPSIKTVDGFRAMFGEDHYVVRFQRVSELVMEGIDHKIVAVNGINIHIAEKGEGPVVLLLHGFPELWYSWRHQILSLASWGYRAIAPDLRGYGDTDAPPAINSYTILHLVGDVTALLDSLDLDQVFVVGHDWGAIVAWHLSLFRPERVKALVNLSVHFLARNPSVKPIDGFRYLFGDDHYMVRFQEPGEIEAEFAQVDVKTLMKNFLTLRDPGPILLPKGGTATLYSSDPITLPSWLSKEDIDYYASKFKQKGFTGGVNYYRARDLTWELTAAWTGAKVNVPTKFIVGDLDLVYNIPGAKEYIHGGGFKKDVPFLQEVVVMEGVAHFINQEKADEISKHIYDFIKNY